MLRKKSKNNRRTQDTARKSLGVETLEKRELFAADAVVGIFMGTWWHVDNNNPAPLFGPAFRSHPNTVSFGLSGDQPVLGDWNGDGTKTPGIFRNGTWVLDIEGNGFDATDRVLSFGLPGDRAVAGDWNGDGIDTVGVYRNGTWYFDQNGNGYDSADQAIIEFGMPNDIPIAGDWNGDGRDTPGVFRNGEWVLDLTGNGFDHNDRFLQFGLPGDQPIAGDWTGDGRDKPGVLQNDKWFLDREGNGFTGEIGVPNRLGSGIAVAGNRVRFAKPPISSPSDAVSPVTTNPITTNPNDNSNPAIPSNPASVIGRVGNGGEGTPLPNSNTPAIPASTFPELDVTGFAAGQSSIVTFRNVTLSQASVVNVVVRNQGTGELAIHEVNVSGGFLITRNLPRSIAPGASAILQLHMETSTIGNKAGTLTIVNNDADEGRTVLTLAGQVSPDVSSRFGKVLASNMIASDRGVLVVKEVEGWGAPHNRIKLYGDFYSINGDRIRTDVPIGDISLTGNQTSPKAVALVNGNFVIAWKHRTLVGSNIRYAIYRFDGANMSGDRRADITFHKNRELVSLSASPSGQFTINWRILGLNGFRQRTFQFNGEPITGEIVN